MRCSTLLPAIAAVYGIVWAAAGPAQADDPATNADSLGTLVRQLDAEDFETRRNAKEQLVAAGSAAVEVVRDAAAEASGQRAAECVNVLRQLAQRPDECGPMAKAALERLSQGDNQEVAALAATTLREPRPPEIGRPNILGGIRFNAAGPPFRNGQRQVAVEDKGRKVEIVELQTGPITVKITETVNGEPKTTEIKADHKSDLLRKNPEAYLLYRRHLATQIGQMMANGAPAAAGGGFHIHMHTSNGQRTIDVTEPGRKVRIQDSQGKNIVVEVTETVDGKETTKKVEAATLEELKQKDAAAASSYEKYTAAGGGFRFQGNGLPFNANPFNVNPPQVPGVPPIPGLPGAGRRGDRPEAAHQNIETALERLQEVRKELETLKGAQNADPQQLEALVEKLRVVEKELFAAQAQLED